MVSLISDRTITGTIQACRSGKGLSGPGLLAEARLERNLARLNAFVRNAPRIEINSSTDKPDEFYAQLAKKIEKLFAYPKDTVRVTLFSSRTYRKTTQFSQLRLFDVPWLILKAYSEKEIGPQLLRALREYDGAKAFGAIPEVEAPQVIQIFALRGKKLPAFNVVVAETIVSGMPALNYLEMAAAHTGPERERLIEIMRKTFKDSAKMLAAMHEKHTKSASLSLEDLSQETMGLIDLLQEKGVLTGDQGNKIEACVKKLVRRIGSYTPVLAHRDFTSNNMVYHLESGRLGIVDLEKSDVEYIGKDLAKFTESLFVDGKSIGLKDEEIQEITKSFLDTYFDSSKSTRSSIWRFLRFYQIYTCLSFMRYAHKRDDETKCHLLLNRIADLCRC